MTDKRKEFMQMVQQNLFILDPKCHICGDKDNLQFHHIIPLSNGGNNIKSNIITLCGKCHGMVHNNTGLQIAREKISQNKKGLFILIDNTEDKKYECNGWEEVAKTICFLIEEKGYQYSIRSNVNYPTAKTIRTQASKIKKNYNYRIIYTEEGALIPNFMYKGNVDLLIKDTKRKDGF